MRLALELARKSLQRQFTYRTANIAGFFTNLFFGILRASLMISLFAARASEAGYTLRDAITYTALSQAFLSFMMMFGWWDLIRAIRSGDISTTLIRPVDLFGWWWWQDVGRALVQVLWRGVPIIAIFGVMYGINLPPDLVHWLALPISMLLGLLTSFAYRYAISLTALWTRDAVGIGRLGWGVSNVLSGFLVPVAFFPDWLAALARFTPFPSMVNTPVEVYLGLVSGPALWGALLAQALWAGGMVGLCYLLQAAGLRKLVIQGG
ncbi:MAG: ABC-2 family transporter protein [Chloroflexi bacterium]|nr:ABC-2 family transporter protein [Chloroflexota bacterium]